MSIDSERFAMALQAHAAEHTAMRERGLARRVTLGGCSRCPRARPRALGALSPMTKSIAAAGVVGGITIGFLALLVWASKR